MVGIISGNTLGLNLGSLAALGARGRIGTAEQGRAGERTYVNVATGDLVLQDQDTSLAGVGSLAAAVRTYNSQGLLTGWRETPVKSVVKVGTLLRRTDVDGSVCDYIWNGTRRVYEAKTAPGSVQDTMIHDASGTYTWTDRSTGSKETYQGSGSGLIVSSTDTNGNTLTYSYDAAERLLRIDNSNGDALRYTYGTLADGRKTVQIGAQVSGALRNEVTYTYDTQGRLQDVTIDLDPENKLPPEAKGASSYTTSYDYYPSSNRIWHVSQSDGTKLTLTYALVDGTYRIETVTDGEGNATSFAYDTALRTSPALYATAYRTTTVTDPLGVVTAYDSDARGQLLGIRSGVNSVTPNGQRWVKYTYNALGDVETVTDSLGSTVTLKYDTYGNLLAQTDTAGNCVTWGYNSRNFPRRQTVNRVPADAAMAATAGETTRYAWDPDRDLLRFVVDATGRVTEHRYDANGLRLCTITYTSAVYDLSALGVEENGPTAAELATWAAALDDQTKTQRTDYTYDVRGQLMSATTYESVDASGNGVAATAQTTNYVFDEHGQLLHTYSATAKSDTTYVRDGLGRVVVVVSKTKDGSAPVTTTTLYDDATATTTVTLSNGLVTKTTYDRAGRLIGQVQSGRDITTATTRYFYDRDGRLVMTEDPTAKRSWRLYDDLGNQVADVDATGHLTEYVHDADGRLTQTIRYATAVDTALLVDASGNPTASPADPNARVTLAKIQVADPTKDEKSWTLYDASGRLAWQVDALGYVTETQYDGASRVIGTRRLANPVDTMQLGDGSRVRFDSSRTQGFESSISVSADAAAGSLQITTTVSGWAWRTDTERYPLTGTVTLFTGETCLGSFRVPANSGGDVTFVTGTAYWPRTAPLRVVYSGDENYAAATVVPSVEIPPASVDIGAPSPLQVTLSTSSASVAQGGALSLTASIQGSPSSGLVTFTVGTTVLGVAEVVSGNATLSLAHLNLDPGTATIKATYLADAPATSNGAAVEVRPGVKYLALSSAAPGSDRTTARIYDAAGLLIGVVDAKGYLIEYVYDAAGRQVETIAYAATAKEFDTSTWSALLQTARSAHSVAGLKPAPVDPTDPASEPEAIRTYTYYNARGQVIAQVDGERYLTEFAYDELGKNTSTSRYAKQLDPANVTITTASLVSYLEANAGTARQVTSRTWDGLGRLATETNAEGTVTEHAYDAAGHLISTTVARGTTDERTTSARYDALGRVTAELSAESAKRHLSAGMNQAEVDAVWASYGRSYAYDAAGHRTSSTDANKNRTVYYYDDAGRLRFTIDAEGGIEETTYNALGHVETSTRFAAWIDKQQLPQLRGGLLSDTENADGSLSARERLDLARTMLVGRNSKSVFHYDTRGNVIETIDPENRIVTSDWNEFGELKRTREMIGDELEKVTRYFRDRLGQIDEVTNYVDGTEFTPLGWTASKYDAYGRVTESTDRNGNVAITTYDALGRIVTVEDPTQHVRRTTWDAFGRVFRQTDALNQTTAYEYDDAARTVTVTTPEGVKVTTKHNREGQTETIVRWDGTSAPLDNQEDRTTYAYDADGHLKSVTTPLTTTSSVYDEGGRLRDTFDANGNRVHYEYDAANRVLSRTVDPDGLALTTSYLYDAKGQAYQVTDANGVVTRFTFDRNGEVLTQTVDPDGLALMTVYTYDSRRNVKTVQTPGATVTEYAYDGLNRRIETKVEGRITERYGYDRNGNLAWRDDGNGNHTVFAYDKDNRLVYTVDGAGNVKKNEYDANGRVVAVISYKSPLTGYSRFGGPGGDKAGTLLGLDATWPNGYGPTSIADVEARLVTASGEYGDVVERRLYDGDGRMKFMVDGTGGVVEYTYDTKGNVIERLSYATKISIASWNPSAGSTPTEKLAGLQAVLTRDPQHDLRLRTAYDLLNRPVATIDAMGAVKLNVYDANGNVVAEVAPAKTVSVNGLPTDRGFADALVSAAKGVRDPDRDRCVRNVYDAANRLVWTVDGNGAVTERVYQQDRMVKRVAYAKTVSAEAKAFQLVDLRHERTPFTAEFLSTAAKVGDYGGSVEAAVSDGPALQDRVEQFAYDGSGRLTFHVAADGAVTRQVFDLNGNVALRCAFRYPRAAPLARWEAPSDAELAVQFAVGEARIEGFVYDAANRLQYTVAADGAVTQNDYDGAGNVVATTRYGVRTSACYDLVPANVRDVAATLRTGVEQTIGGSNPLAPPNRTTLYAYDAAGRLAYTVTATQIQTGTNAAGQPEYAQRGFVQSQELDAAGRVVLRTVYETPITTVHHRMTGSELQASTALAQSRAQRTRYEYDAAGRLRLVEDPLQFTEHYTYDALGNRKTYQDKNNRIWDYDYDAAGRRVRELTPEVKRVHVSTSENDAWSIERVERLVTETVYDALGDVTERIEAVGTADQRITSYVYDQVGRRVATVHPEVAVAGSSVPMKLTSRVRYDAFGDAVETIDTAGVSSYAAYDQLGRVAYEIDAEGYATGYERNAFGDVETLTRYAHAPTLALDGDAPTTAELKAAVSVVAGERDRVRKTQYDQMGRVALVEDFKGSGAGASVGASVKNAYDVFGNLVEVSTLVDLDPVTWSTVTHYYDQRGLEIATIDPLGYLTEQTYDAAGNVLTRTRHAVASPSWTSEDFTHPPLDHEDRIETFVYDADGRLTVANDASGISEVYGYDNDRNRTSYTNRKGYTWAYEYDALGRMVKETSPQVSLTSASVTDGHIAVQESSFASVVTSLEYDPFGNVTARTEAVGRLEERTTRYVYDSWGRQVTTILPPVDVYAHESAGQLAANGAGGNARRVELQQTIMTRVEYDQAGNAVVGTDASKYKSFKVYDRAGHIAYEIDADGYVTRYDRNAFGEVTTLTRYATAVSAEADGWSAAPSRPEMDELMSRNLTGQDRAITTEYDDLGRVIRVVQPKAWEGDEFAAETTYWYDLAGRLRQTSSRIDATRWATTTYICDLKGQQTAIVDAEKYVTVQEYDAFGQVRRRTEYAHPTNNYSIRLLTLPDDPLNRNRTVKFAYDRLGRKISETRLDVEYTDLAGIEEAVRAAGNGAKELLKRRFNPWETQVTARGDLTTHYGYDAVGNQTRVTDALGNSTYTYYDALGRISAIAAPTRSGIETGSLLTPVTTYERDAHGNVLRKIECARGAATLPIPGARAPVAVDEYGGRIWSLPVADLSDRVLPTIAPDDRDRITLEVFDVRGSVLQETDANGVDHYKSYDRAGRVAKQWVTVSQYDATTATSLEDATLFTAFEYDRRGNQTRMTTPGSSTGRDSGNGVAVLSAESRVPVVTKARYNAFGEVEERATYANEQLDPPRNLNEWFEYDNAGRVWRTQGSDGVVKVMRHDLLGRVTAEITSAGSNGSSVLRGEDLGSDTLKSVADVLALGEERLRQTDYVLDLLGHIKEQYLPARRNTSDADGKIDPAPVRPVIKQWFDRWGNLDLRVDPSGLQVSFAYDKNNRVIGQTQSGDTTRPETQIFYDQLGRQVAVRDANHNVNVQLWDAGGQLATEIHADVGLDEYSGRVVGIVSRSYDAFGDQVRVVDAMGYGTTYGYDRLGRNTTVSSESVAVATPNWVKWDLSLASGLDPGRAPTADKIITTNKRYDALGRVYQDVNGAGEARQYAYDLRGNIVASRKPMGQVTQSAFDVAGRQIRQANPEDQARAADGTSYVTRDCATWEYDAFGRLESHRDIGGGTHTYQYDAAGQLWSQADVRDQKDPLPSQTVRYTYDAAGQMAGTESVETTYTADGAPVRTTKTAAYTFDKSGRHISEKLYLTDRAHPLADPVWLQDQTLRYDGLGRVQDVYGLYGWDRAYVEVHYSYDDAGNIRQHNVKRYNPFGPEILKTYRFAYDEMNRQVMVDGAVDNDPTNVANINKYQGHILKYDRNGNRTADIAYGEQVVAQGGGYSRQSGLITHYYEYDRLNRLVAVYVGKFDDSTTVAGNSLSSPGVVATRLDTRQYDAASRTVRVGLEPDSLPQGYRDALTAGSASEDGALTRATAYDANGQIIAQSVYHANGTLQSAASYQSGLTDGVMFPDDPGGQYYDSNGNLRRYIIAVVNNGVADNRGYSIQRIKGEGYLESKVTFRSYDNPDLPGGTVKTYDANGFLATFEDLTIKDATKRKEFVNDLAGRALMKRTWDEKGTLQVVRQMVVNGNVVAIWGLDEGGTHYNPNRRQDFSIGFEPITNSYPDAAIGAYQVRAGDTLESIAVSSYGDASLWYVIADANGLSGNADLRVGQTVQIPTRVQGAFNTAKTFRPYDPSKIVGNTAPNVPTRPPSRDKWRLFKAIVVAVIKVAVTVVVSYYAGPVAGSIAGEVAGQFAGLCMGLQDDFDWKGIAKAGLMGLATWGVGAAFSWASSVAEAAETAQAVEGTAEAVNAASSLAETTAEVAAATENVVADAAIVALRAAATNAATQGLEIAVGLQKGFHWSDVAAAGLSSVLTSAVGGTLREFGTESEQLGRYGQAIGRLATETVTGFATGLTLTAMKGGRVCAEQIAMDAFGNALGNSLGGALTPARAIEGPAEPRDPVFRDETSAGGLEEIDRAQAGTSSSVSASALSDGAASRQSEGVADAGNALAGSNLAPANGNASIPLGPGQAGGGPFRMLLPMVLAQVGGPMNPDLDSYLETDPATRQSVPSLDPTDAYFGLFPQQGAWEGTTDPANPYAWVAGSATGLPSVAAVVGGDLRVYGTQGESDITTYSANDHGLIDVTTLEQHADANFESTQTPGREENFLGPRQAAALFNVAQAYAAQYPDDDPLVFTGGSTANGQPAVDQNGVPLHASHHNGANLDLRYMGSNGTALVGNTAAANGDVARNTFIIDQFDMQNANLGAALTGDPARYGLNPIPQQLQNIHRNHMHLQTNYPHP